MHPLFLEIIIGVFAALVLAFLVRKWRAPDPIAFWRMALVIAACIYVAFAIIGKNWAYLPMELVGLILYGSFALLSLRFSLYFLVAGWTLHVLWDIFLHPGGHPGYVPDWYPGVCLGFDLLIGAYLIWEIVEKSRLKN